MSQGEVKLLCGKTAQYVTKESDKEFIENFKDVYPFDLIRVLPEKFCLPTSFVPCQENYMEYEISSDDTFVCGFPKSGTSYCSDIVWTLLNNKDFSKDQSAATIFDRSPPTSYYMFNEELGMTSSMEYYGVSPPKDRKITFTDYANALGGRKVFKDHFYPGVFPKMLDSSKIVYIARHPVDNFVSMYHFSKLFQFAKFNGTMDQLIDCYVKGYVPFGTSVKHLKEWYKYRNHKNVLFLHYEQLKADKPKEIRRIASHLGVDVTDEQINKLIQKTSFEIFKKEFGEREKMLSEKGILQQMYDVDAFKEGNMFFRKGKSGHARDELTDAQYDKLAENCKKELEGIEHPYQF